MIALTWRISCHTGQLQADGFEMTIDVQDDGPGIPADRLPALFNARPGQTRLGLGLSMVREVVAALSRWQLHGSASTRHDNPPHAAGLVTP
jgi:C4-dicarboxylate-specific signal transduction histidine kinase